jgi:predicted amidohydrolase
MTASTNARPCKIVVGTSMYSMWFKYPGLEDRLRALTELIDRMAEEAGGQYGAGPDLAVLPEVAVNGGLEGPAAEVSFPLEGAVLDLMGAAARKHHTYVVVPMYLAEGEACYNAGVLLDRTGQVAGIYRKVHVVQSLFDGTLEGGCALGTSFPVFECDFGRVGIQICFDIFFDDGWEVLARRGAQLVAWTSQAPHTVEPRGRALRHGYHIISSTWRNNASVFDPVGQIIAQTTESPGITVVQLDVNSVVIPWQPGLDNGAAFTRRYGEGVGYRYTESEDRGLFWSNDPAVPIRQMIHELGLELIPDLLARNLQVQDAARGGPPDLG